MGFPPGHFHSPIPSLEDIRRREQIIFDTIPPTIPSINLNEAGQIGLFEDMAHYYDRQPFSYQKNPNQRFSFENDFYVLEAVILYCMMRIIKPTRIVEVGSGFSSAAILDINELFFHNSINCTFIEPHPEDRLHKLLRLDDYNHVNIIQSPLQAVGHDLFTDLGSGDLLFIDSSHVSKIDSDVNHIFFSIFPQLQTGVYIHFHDIFYPFEYPKEWIYQGRAWNEAYVLRAFLQYNETFRIEFFNSFFSLFFQERVREKMPLCKDYMGSSIWLSKVRP